DVLIIHGRTRKQMSDVPADWEMIGKIREMRDRIAPETLIVGNGDVENRKQALELAAKYDLDGIMIGRGVFHDPFVFAAESPWDDYDKYQRMDLFAQHVKLFAQTWADEDCRIATLNKFCKIYINGFDGVKELREKLMRADNATEILELLTQK
ncbi:MAG TPA: tRNA-dihydrouridine synthase, partial [Candidatus Saccharimonadales bacterium]